MQTYSHKTSSRSLQSSSRRCFTSSKCPQRPALRSQSTAGQQRRIAAEALVGCKLVGVGSSVPATVLSNTDLEKFVETNDEWISTRTGIKRRHVLADGESMAGHAAEACKKALEMANVAAADVDMVIMATSTPDDAFGSACQV